MIKYQSTKRLFYDTTLAYGMAYFESFANLIHFAFVIMSVFCALTALQTQAHRLYTLYGVNCVDVAIPSETK